MFTALVSIEKVDCRFVDSKLFKHSIPKLIFQVAINNKSIDINIVDELRVILSIRDQPAVLKQLIFSQRPRLLSHHPNQTLEIDSMMNNFTTK